MFGKCDHAGDPSVGELCEVGCLLGFRTTSSVPGHAAVANDKLHPCARSSARRAEQECPEPTMYRDRCRERTRFWSAVRREREPVKVDTIHGALPVRRMLLIGLLVPRCGAMHSALRRHGIRSAPAPAMLIGVPFRYSIAAAPNLTPSSTKPSVHHSRRFLLGVAGGLCVRCGGRASGHKSGAGSCRGHPQRHHRGRRGNGLELRPAGVATVRGGRQASVRSAGRSAMMKS
ncbi:hypothetical protein TcCL_NonESM01666 [Trypanosoma cruzi]|nr:hypothetical protein TcCL_NonESM01666 [Trypanosoma cruzi]